MAVRKLANNPELRAKVASVVREELVPRAKQGWEQAKPELEKAKERARKLAEKLKN
jgi:hypothetical protein